MPYELHEIKKIRKSLALTQTDLAKMANVSQSLIAKIESGKIDPTFTKTKKIFETLHLLQNKEEKREKSPPTVSKTGTVKVFSSLLKAHPIVFLLESAKLVGLITKADLL